MISRICYFKINTNSHRELLRVNCKLAHLLNPAMSLRQFLKTISSSRVEKILWELNDIRKSRVETEIFLEQLLHTTLQFMMCCTSNLSPWPVYSHPITLDAIQFHVLDDSAVHKNQLGPNHANTIWTQFLRDHRFFPLGDRLFVGRLSLLLKKEKKKKKIPMEHFHKLKLKISVLSPLTCT